MIKLFLTFFRISALTIGGGYAMIPVIEKNLEKMNWMQPEDFYTLLTIAQSLPGPVAFNISWLVGKKLKGMPGAIIAAFAVMIPPFFTILIASSLIMKYRDNTYVQGFLKGAYGALIGMVGGIMYKLIRNQKWDIYKVILISASIVIFFLKSDIMIPIFLFLVISGYIAELKRSDI